MNTTVTPRSEKAWHDFLTQIETVEMRLGCGDNSDCEAWFRGHTKCNYPLLPSLFRCFPDPDSDENWIKVWNKESDLFWEFTARARELHTVIEDDWDYLFAMQHYGTPTRLLDWTEVLGVAVYFATLGVDETGPISPCVWVLNPYRLNGEGGEEEDDLTYPTMLGWDEKEQCYYTYGELLLEEGLYFDEPVAIYPRQRNPRLHAQRAWFTIHGDRFIPMESIEGHEAHLERVELPFEAIPAARRFLRLAGIDHYLLFADLESLSLHLREKNDLLTRAQADAAAKKRLENREGPAADAGNIASISKGSRGRKSAKQIPP